MANRHGLTGGDGHLNRLQNLERGGLKLLLNNMQDPLVRFNRKNLFYFKYNSTLWDPIVRMINDGRYICTLRTPLVRYRISGKNLGLPHVEPAT